MNWIKNVWVRWKQKLVGQMVRFKVWIRENQPWLSLLISFCLLIAAVTK